MSGQVMLDTNDYVRAGDVGYKQKREPPVQGGSAECQKSCFRGFGATVPELSIPSGDLCGASEKPYAIRLSLQLSGCEERTSQS